MENRINEIDKTRIKTDKITLLIKDILAKKELANLNPEFILEKVKIFLNNHKKAENKLEQNKFSEFKRSKEHKELMKHVRAELREIYGVFILKGYEKRYKLLEELKKDPSLENHNQILNLHKSSKERLPYYSIVYKRIIEITGKPKRIVDLACGLNPISYPYLGFKPDYIACDLAEKDLEFIQKYFDLMNIKGKTKKIDLINEITDNLASLTKKDDLVLLFKALDSLEAIQRNISSVILQSLKAKQIVVSFSTQSLGGRKAIKKEKRNWFSRVAENLNFKISSFEIPNEMFYVLTR
ncbi:MAG: hypothetical protein KKF46_08370 [Nanoarchaeota archaeon]|nr:hypothetical protein [Nanoarchaeota archaeon]MBU1322344.1 hypothetical protein [Nanoarchaeota archaeon]MBU1596980.1 hypothetical protein [Nanoarchaeota archaeon]MBU2441168.1 hypothetical protein [Nanoarchaeota archaeon]